MTVLLRNNDQKRTLMPPLATMCAAYSRTVPNSDLGCRIQNREPLHASRKTETACSADLHRNRAPRGSETCWLYSDHLQFGGLLVQSVPASQSCPRRESSKRQDLQPQSRSDVQRCIVLWDDGSRSRHTPIGQGYKLDFGIKSNEFCIQKAVAIVSSQAYIR